MSKRGKGRRDDDERGGDPDPHEKAGPGEDVPDLAKIVETGFAHTNDFVHWICADSPHSLCGESPPDSGFTPKTDAEFYANPCPDCARRKQDAAEEREP